MSKRLYNLTLNVPYVLHDAVKAEGERLNLPASRAGAFFLAVGYAACKPKINDDNLHDLMCKLFEVEQDKPKKKGFFS